MKKTVSIIPVIISVLLLGSCKKEEKTKIVEGYKPIYATTEQLNRVETRENEPLHHPGRIYCYNHFLLVNDEGLGIHIFDNSDITQPKHISFIAIPGNMDFSVKNGILYADNITDLVLINIADPAKPVYVNRIQGVFPVQQFPDAHGAFECTDPSQGVVIGWEKTTLTNPKCYR